jgi:hypothetical protein
MASSNSSRSSLDFRCAGIGNRNISHRSSADIFRFEPVASPPNKADRDC